MSTLRFQPHGAVVVLDRTGRVRHVSSNAAAVLGKPAERLVGTEFVAMIPRHEHARFRTMIRAPLRATGWQRFDLSNDRRVKVRTYEVQPDLLGVDVLIAPLEADADDAQAVERVAGWSERLAAALTADALVAAVATNVRERTGYDGAWVTELQPDGSSLIVGGDQVRGPNLVGRVVPAEDMPPAQSMVEGRYVPFFVADLAAPAATLVPAAPGPDLGGSALLRPYPAFLKNLERDAVRAYLSVPVVVDGRLWGRITAANGAARRLTVGAQSELTLMGVAAGYRLTELAALQAEREARELSDSATRVARALSRTADVASGLAADADALLGMAAADGAIIAVGGAVRVIGLPLTDQSTEQLLADARSALREDDVTRVHTASSPAGAGQVAGYLAIKLAADVEDVVVWVRKERPDHVTVITRDGGDMLQTARFLGDASGAMAQAVVERRGRSAPWTDAQLQQVDELRDAVGDLTFRRYAQAQSLAAELQRSNAEYDAFARAAAHDLKAPLRGILLTAGLLSEDADDRLTGDDQRQLTTILRLADRMNDMLDALLDYARTGQEALEQEPIELHELVGEVREILDPAGDRARISCDQGVVSADRPALRQLLLNLLENAIKYSDAPADITVSLLTLGQTRHRSAVPDTLARANPAMPVVAVTDRGVGIAAEHHERIFEMFTQLHPEVDGSGAGLAICRLICRRHGGEVWVDAAPGEGATFYAAVGDDQDHRTVAPRAAQR